MNNKVTFETSALHFLNKAPLVFIRLIIKQVAAFLRKRDICQINLDQ